MKWLFLTLTVFSNHFISITLAQTYSITYSKHFSNQDWIQAYDKKIEGTPITLQGPSEIIMLALFNDSISFCDAVLYNGDHEKSIVKQFERIPKKKKLPFAYFSLRQNDSTYNLRYSPQRNEKILVKESLPERKWHYDTTGTLYLIIGYECHFAYSRYENGDTAFAYFTNQLPAGFGPAYFRGLNGFVLAAHDQKYSVTYIAKSIEKASLDIKLPENFILLTRKEYDTSKSAATK